VTSTSLAVRDLISMKERVKIGVLKGMGQTGKSSRERGNEKAYGGLTEREPRKVRERGPFQERRTRGSEKT